jgi:Tfp pilus assembly protein PilO
MATKTIKTKQDLIEWADRVNMCTDVKTKVNLQDEFCHSTVDDLHRVFSQLEPWIEAKLPIFALLKAMSHDTLMTYLKIYTNSLADRAFQELKKEIEEQLRTTMKKLNEKEQALLAAQKETADLRAHIEKMLREIDKKDEERDQLSELSQKSAQQVLDLTQELSFHRSFHRVLREYAATDV